MVVIFLPSTADSGSEHERIATPSTWTVQAPHWAMPHPYLVPVSPSVSRSTHKSGVSGSTSTSRVCPLILRRAILLLLIDLWHSAESVLASILSPSFGPPNCFFGV